MTIALRSAATLRTDVTAHERVHRLPDVGSGSHDPLVILLDPLGRIEQFDRPTERVSGFAAADVRGRCVWEVLSPPHERDSAHRDFDRACATDGGVVEQRWRTKDGRERLVRSSFTILRHGTGQVRNVVQSGIDVTHSRAADDSLRAANERFALAIAGANDGLWDWDLRTDACYYSPRYKSMLGYAADDIGGDVSAFERLLHPDDQARVLASIHEYLAGRSDQFEVEARLRHKDGHYVDVIGRARVARGSDGTPSRLVGTTLDVTEQKALRRRLAIQCEVARVLAKPDSPQTLLTRTLSAVCGAGGWDMGCVRTVNSDLERLDFVGSWPTRRSTANCPAEKPDTPIARGAGMSGRAWDTATPQWQVGDGLPPGMQTGCVMPLCVDGRCIAVFEYYSREVHHRDEDLLTVLGSIDAHVAEALEQARIRDDLARIEQRYRDIVEQAVVGMYQSTLDGRFLSVNPAFARHLGYESCDDFMRAGVNALTLYADGARRADFIQALTEHGSVLGFEARIRRRNGSVFWTSNYARLVKDTAGQVLSIEGVVEDVTEQKEAERLKLDFVSLATHQLRTPLAGIKWLLELADSPALPSEEASYVHDARLSADRLIHLVNDLLRLSRLESEGLVLTTERVDLEQLTRDVVSEWSPVAIAKHQAVTISFPVHVPPVLADPQLTKEVFGNLLSNALRYTPDGGAVAIDATESSGAVEWAIHDTGIGIPESAREHLFEKFFRAPNASTSYTEGTGLGLYIARLIIERLGGSIGYDSRAGQGSTFRVTLPSASSEEAL